MQKSLVRWSMIWAMVLVSSTTDAQEKGQIGVPMAYPVSIGVVWHATDRLAIRPEFAFSKSSTETSGPEFDLSPSGIPTYTVTQRELSSVAVSVGLSGLLYISRSEGLSTYISPRFSYSRISQAFSDNYFGAFVGPTDEPRPSYSVGGSFGAQYAPSRTFSIFGEVGIAQNHSSSRYTGSLGSGGAETTSEYGSISSRGVVGIVLYVR